MIIEQKELRDAANNVNQGVLMRDHDMRIDPVELAEFAAVYDKRDEMAVTKRKIFVSYTQVDREWAEWIAWQIEAAGHEVRIQAWDFPPGSNFVAEMDRATAECDRTVAVLSPEYLEKAFTQPEWMAAFSKDPTGEQRTLLPIRVRDCEIEGLLRQVVYLDLVGVEEAAACEKLLQALGGERGKPSIPPAHPRAFPGESESRSPSREAPEISRYRLWAGERHSRVDLVGVGAGDVRLRLEEIYVPLRMAWRREEKRPGPGADALAVAAEAGEEDLALDRIFPILEDRGQRHAVVLGQPGAGKTTALRKLAQECLKDPQSLGLEPGSLPVFLPLRWLVSKDLELSFEVLLGTYLAEVSSGELSEKLGGELWRRGRLLLLLDGLDEVAEDRRRAELASWLEWHLRRSGPAPVRSLVTSRFAGYGPQVRLGESFLAFEIRPLEARQVEQLVRRWFQEAQRSTPDYPEEQARRRAEGLVAALAGEEYSSQRLKVLVSSPLLLTLLCVIVWRGGEMPRERVQFFEQCLRVLLGSWGKTTKEREPLLALEPALALLRPLAWQLHFDNRRDDLSRVELVNHLRKRLGDLNQSASPFAVLDWLYREAGVLAEYAPQRYGFMHLGIQEYLAAAHVASRGEELAEVVAAVFGERWWREVIHLLFALPGHRALRPLLDKVVASPALTEHGDLLRECLAEAAEIDVEPVVVILREGGDPAREAAALRVLRGRCQAEVVAEAERLAASSSAEVAALARRLVDTCRQDAGSKATLDHDVFLVHDLAEEAGARALGAALKGRGLRLLEASDWESRLEELVENTRAVAVLVGAGGRAPWEERKVRALLELLEAEQRALVPVLLPGGRERLKLPGVCTWSSWVDLRGGLEPGGCEALERSILEREERDLTVRPPGDEVAASAERWLERVSGMPFVWVSGGRFEMGGKEEYEGKPVHEVEISPFWLGETPVTNRQYGLFLEKTRHGEPQYWRDARFSDPEQPVVGVSWHEAVRFCEWLSQESGREVQLPSEAQWEFAARGTDGRIYPWGDESPDETRACYGLDWQTDQPAAVGSKAGGRGPFGTLDQAGNVWEWCLDVWNPKVYRERAGRAVADPVVTEGDSERRVLRGGGWFYPAEFLRAAFRYSYPAAYRDDGVGFRVSAAPASFGF
jgi:formylglycine-generating enzyme required for sulfatase activity